jgi:hypothetical protein
MELHEMEERLHNEEGGSKSKMMRFSMKILFFERLEEQIYLKNYGTSADKINEDSEGMNLTQDVFNVEKQSEADIEEKKAMMEKVVKSRDDENNRKGPRGIERPWIKLKI